MSVNEYQTAKVTIRCTKQEHVDRVASTHREQRGVVSVTIVGLVVEIMIRVLKREVLPFFGRIKDATGWRAECTLTPVRS